MPTVLPSMWWCIVVALQQELQAKFIKVNGDDDDDDDDDEFSEVDVGSLLFGDCL